MSKRLRKGFGLPGMRVLQFGFGGNPEDVHLPHMHDRDSIVYTGTHDNDTTMGWFLSLDSETQRRVEYFLRLTPGAMPEALIRTALASVGKLAILPMQDALGLGSEARLNTPGTADGELDVAPSARRTKRGSRATLLPAEPRTRAL